MTRAGVERLRLQTSLALAGGSEVQGHVFDADNLDTRFVVELLADGCPVGLTRADVHRRDLEVSGTADGCYGFVFALTPAVLANTEVLEVRVANTGHSVGTPLKLETTVPTREQVDHSAAVRWLGGLRLSGWLAIDTDQVGVRALVDGKVVAEASALSWTHIERGGNPAVARAFDLYLPASLADGRVRQVEVVASDGRIVVGSPCPVVAFTDGLEAFVSGHAELASETLRARFFDRIIPQSLSFSDYEHWAKLFPASLSETTGAGALAVVLVGDNDLDTSLDSLNAQLGADWVGVAVPGSGPRGGFDRADLSRFLAEEAADCDTVVFALSGTRFAPSALGALARALALFPQAQAAYTDVLTKVGERHWPLAFSAFDYERCLEQGYCSLFFALRRTALLEAIERGAGDIFRVFNAHLDGNREPERLPVHVPEPLATVPSTALRELQRALQNATKQHLAARGMDARLSAGGGASFPAVRVGRSRPRGRVSVVIPTRNRHDLLEPCLAALHATAADTDYDVIIADNDSSHPDTLSFLERVKGPRLRVVRIPGPFNYARINNIAASHATGDHLLLMNNDVKAVEEGWMSEMLGRMAEPDVGAVGALLLWPSGVVQHGGIVLGPNFSAVESFGDRMGGDPGYGDLLGVARECSAVTGACLMTPRKLFVAHDGLDAGRFPVNYNDVDYCLRLRESGYRVVFTPHARLLHRESSSRGPDLRPDQTQRRSRELGNLRSRWGDTLGADPYYSPMLSLDAIPFSALAWPPGHRGPRQPRWPVSVALPPGF